MELRIALTGASGTGKTVLAEYLSKKLDLPFNPVGSRSVASAMGYDKVYDVDADGRRGEFQTRLINDKTAWESEHESFVTDRTTIDNLVYTIMHDVSAVTPELLAKVKDGAKRYTHVIHCPVNAFCNPGGDPDRVQDLTYQNIYDMVLIGALERYMIIRTYQNRVVLFDSNLEDRKQLLDRKFNPSSERLNSDGIY